MEGHTVLDAIRQRRSIRRFAAQDLTDDEIEAVLEAGRWAPSGLNNQPWRFLVVRHGDPRVEALAAIRAGGYAALPVVALTADAMAGERDRLLALGFDGYVSKPIDPAELISALGAALDPAPSEPGDDQRACA